MSQYILQLTLINFDKKEKYLIFSGIGNPKNFKKMLLNNNFNIVKDLEFPDHYQYKYSDIQKIKMYAKSLNAKILTTEKDFLRLSNIDKSEIDYIKIEILIKNNEELINFLRRNI